MSKVAKFVTADARYLTHAHDAAFAVGDIYWDMVVWAKFTGRVVYPGLVFKGVSHDANYEYALWYQTAGYLYFVVRDMANSSNGYLYIAISIPNDAWSMIHCYHNPVTNEIGLSVNVGTHVTLAWAGGIRDSNADIKVGVTNIGGGDYYCDGAIGPFAIWKPTDTNLTQAQLKQLYRGGFGLNYADLDAGLLAGLQAWYQMDEATGDRVDAVAALNLAEAGGTVSFEESLLDIPMPTVHW